MKLEPDSRQRLQPLLALLCGTLFGLGLAISRMIDPAKVLGFLDFSGAWDPTLAFVMAGALAVAAPGFRCVLKRDGPWFAPAFALPAKTDLEPRLVAGAALFGIGWGLAGFCPGPAIAALVADDVEVYAFVAAMIVGFVLHDVIARSEPAAIKRA